MKKTGFIFIEILIAIALISIVFVMLMGLAFRSVNLSSSIQNVIRADTLAREEVEQLRSFRDGTLWATTGIGSATTGQNYYITFNSGTNKYQLNAGTETVSEYTRSLVFEAASRDGSGNIVSSGGANDPDTRKATITVSGNGTSQQIIMYLTNWQKK